VKKTWCAKIYCTNQRTNRQNFKIAQKRHNFDPLLMSLMQQASENFEYKRRQAEVIARSTSYQALKIKKLARNYGTTKLL
jgi:hypothetical protein